MEMLSDPLGIWTPDRLAEFQKAMVRAFQFPGDLETLFYNWTGEPLTTYISQKGLKYMVLDLTIWASSEGQRSIISCFGYETRESSVAAICR
jgi:hypothetical protein